MNFLNSFVVLIIISFSSPSQGTAIPLNVLNVPNLSPVADLADTLRRALTLLGGSSYLLAPTIGSSAKTLSPIVRRFADPAITDSVVQQINQLPNGLEIYVNQALVFLGMNNEPCKEALSCEAGKAISNEFPLVSNYLISMAMGTRSSDKYARIMMQSMNGGDDATINCPSNCPALTNVEKYWKELKENDIATVARNAIKESISNALSSFAVDQVSIITSDGRITQRASPNSNDAIMTELIQAILKSIHNNL